MLTDEKRILETFTELVKIYSPSKGEEALAKVLVEKLSLLNMDIKRDEFGNIIAKMPAVEGVKAPTIFFSAHLDVVEPCKGIEPILDEVDGKIVIRSSGNTVLGADDKAGIAMILEALTYLFEHDVEHGNVEIVFTLQEENGLHGSKAVDTNALESSFGYVLDHSAPIGSAIYKAPQHDNLSFKFKGKAAHAGLQPEDGLNAILVAARAIKNMPYGRLGSETTANVGTITGGKATNIIPDECFLTCEVRSHDVNKINKYVQNFVDAANTAVKDFPGTSVTFLRETEYKCLKIDAQQDLLKYAKKAAEKIGLEFKLVTTCGGSDANVFNNEISCVCLGCGYDNPHATNECIGLDVLVSGADYVVSIIKSVIEREEW